MNNPQLGVLAFFIIIGLVVVINYAIIKRFSGKGSKRREAHFLSRTIEAAKNPWKQENDEIDRLAKLLEKAKMKEEDGKKIKEINRDSDSSNL